MTKSELVINNKYRWVNQKERLVYLVTRHYYPDRQTWFQFALEENPEKVWCEILEDDLTSIERID